MTEREGDRVERVARAITAAAKKHGMSLTAPLMDEWPVDVLARAAIAAAEPRWQPVETAPKDGRRFLVSDGAAVATVWWSAEADEWIGYDTEGAFGAVTHWMPLPPPPAGDNHD